MRTSDIIAYIILFLFFVFIVYIEKDDWNCPKPLSPRKDCSGVGPIYLNTKPYAEDSPEELIKKINKASVAEGNSIKWRRAFILATLTVFVIFILIITPGYLPHWTKFYVSVLSAFAILYVQFYYYSYHVYNRGKDNILESTEYLRDKCT